MEGVLRGRMRFACLTSAVILLLSLAGCAMHPKHMSQAQHYAKDYGVSVEEAQRRLTHMAGDEISVLQNRLRTERADTFAGLYIEHKPTYRIVVRFTGDAQAQLAAYTTDPLYVAQTAPRTMVALHSAQELVGKRLQAAGIEYMSGLEVQTSEIHVSVLDVEKAAACLADLPVMKEGFIHLHKVPGFIDLT